jgi:hypothetical protein
LLQTDNIIDSIKLRLHDFSQETRIRELYERTYKAYQADRTRGIKTALDADWRALKTKFDAAIEAVKKETGIF